MAIETLSESRSFGGTQGVYRHASAATGTDMTFAVYLPPTAKAGPVPVLWYLSGLTCTHENAMTKSGAQEHAAREGIALIFPDTSPRGEGVADDEAFDMGQGAGFYVDATQAPWAPHFRMWDYVTRDLPGVVFDHFPLRRDAQGITGHSMGGHGALTSAWRCPRFTARFRPWHPWPIRPRPTGAAASWPPIWGMTGRHGPSMTPLCRCARWVIPARC